MEWNISFEDSEEKKKQIEQWKKLVAEFEKFKPIPPIPNPLDQISTKIHEQKLDIDSELFDKFINGKTNDEENELVLRQLCKYPDLMEAFNIIVSTAKLVGKEPICPPDLELAEQQISSHLQEVSKNHTK